MKPIVDVALREIVERGRSKAFIVSNVVIVVVIGLATGLPVLLWSDDASRVAAFDDPSRSIVAAASAQGFGAQVELVEVQDREAAQEAVRSGGVEAALVDGTTLLTEDGASSGLMAALEGPARTFAIERSLRDAGLDPERVRQALEVAPLETVALDPAADDGVEDPALFVALIGVTSLYGLLVLYGQWVAQGIVEEKQSRVVEVLLSAVSPLQLLVGKVVGIGLLGLAQIGLIVGLGAGLGVVAFDVALPAGSAAVLALVVAWYLLGYAIYAALFAAVGALCARAEDLQSASMPVFILIFGAIVSVQFVLADPTSTVAQVLAFVPFTAPLVQPVLVAGGVVGVVEVVLAAVLGALTIALLMPLTARMYTGGVLKTGSRVSLRDAWRAGVS